MLSLSCISAAGLVAGPARYATAPSRAFVRAAVAVENAAPAGFYWGYDSSDPAAELVEPEPTPLDRLSFGRFDASSDAISIDEVHTAQANWASAIKTISAVHAEGGDFVDMAATAAGELYGYGKTNVLFKPTKATEHPFRPTAEEAMSYFVGAEAMKNDAFKGEDAGFAINGGRGWKDVTFRNHQVELLGDSAIAMGDYVFVDATSGDEVRVEYTFGYRKVCGACAPSTLSGLCTPLQNEDGKCRIFLHHSSVYAEKGDYVAAAGEAAGQLYGYGHTDVLFKPTKATEHPFRPTAEEAMSYFVGAEAMKNDAFKGEDAGFAINGGRGWKDVTFRNHQIKCYGEVAHAMGDYVFVDATSGDKVRVEYTFGYKRCGDGKVRICLHHSSAKKAKAAKA
ncbi:hypothetical protein EMIHUDRAFT_219806 [Emiliania huxleyi CCMP1516]|uniref:Uncharacterized protein n=2 Tax=Emiliania huxleyi TaxID=2903 RepID=A0A0D3I3B4_EMIH1|nr:hypothetical protein EMIHUDRAFT_219806 [Emiliania huxleyi CCMP1516]EOD05749.1 hypothetical protein EMIHUDRAFT_219806 [Emiliania huxleyi CCMP1516]|eukprot:XP_005758178.1 hypothetical protein EMIHUDRAFT_219806 [Emiliania huxleyi CCMP1516]